MGGEFGLCHGFGGGNGIFLPELTGGAVPVFPECLDEMCFTGITAFQSCFDNTVSILDHIVRQLQPETDQILMVRNAGNRSEICLKFAFSHLVNGTPVGQIVRCIVQHILDIGIGTADDFPSR